jgi:hypothetical protein
VASVSERQWKFAQSASGSGKATKPPYCLVYSRPLSGRSQFNDRESPRGHCTESVAVECEAIYLPVVYIHEGTPPLARSLFRKQHPSATLLYATALVHFVIRHILYAIWDCARQSLSKLARFFCNCDINFKCDFSTGTSSFCSNHFGLRVFCRLICDNFFSWDNLSN